MGLVLASAAYLPGQQQVSLPGTPRAVQEGSARPVGHYSPERMLRLAVVLQPPHMQEEEQFLRELQDMQSPNFHKYLSAKEWDERFAPSAADEQAVANWLQSQGMTITQRFSHRLVVDVEAPAGVIEKALQVTINSYQIGERTYFSNDRDPSIPARFSGVVQAILGLNNIEVVHSFMNRRGARQQPPEPDYAPGPAYSVGPAVRGDGNRGKLDEAMARHKSGPADYWTPYAPTDIYAPTAYDYAALQNLGHCCNPLGNPGGSPPEASIAIAIWQDFADSDLLGFVTTYPYLAYNVQRYFIDGPARCCGDETTLDVEWATATANSFNWAGTTATVHVYEGYHNDLTTMIDVLSQILSDGHARVLSMSWGNAEHYGVPQGYINAYHAVFDQLIGEGWTLVAAAGDAGATGDCGDHVAVDYPASDPDITGVGGTSLSVSNGSYIGEVTWSGGPGGCSTNDGGGGGGCSVAYTAPWYQGPTVCGSGSRSVPDIALNSDGYFEPQIFYYEGYLYYVGGTSIAAPEMAGFFAQENAYLLYLQSIVGDTCGPSLSAPCAPLGPANSYIYQEALHQPIAAHYPFYDITSGCNSNDITQEYGLNPFCAGPGFDQVTAWGSANMLQLAWTVNTFLAGAYGAPVINLSGPPTNRWYNSNQLVSWNITATTVTGHPPNGIAGYSALWDTDPGDVYAESTPGSGNSFYSGPQVANSTAGSIELASAGFGCHTVNVRAWDNAGQPSPDATYGPLCYDNTPPITSVALSGNMYGQYYQPLVLVTLTAIDDLSGVAATYYQIDSGSRQRYSAPFDISTPGPHTLTFYSVDNAGNMETPQSVNFVVVSNQMATLTVSKAGNGSGTVTSTDGLINCGNTCSYASYYVGTPVTLVPTPSPGSVYAGWSGCTSNPGYDCYVVVLNNPTTVTATFNQAVALQFVPLSTPCRVVDTRGPDGQFGGPPIQGGTYRSFPIPQSPQCTGIPAGAAAYSFNVTVVPHGALGYLTVWPAGQPQPTVSTLNSLDGRVKASAAIVPAGSPNASVSVFASNTTDVVLDINGYFIPPGSSTLAFFALPNPCRVIDTRGPNGPLGGPYLTGGVERDFPVLSSSCQLPASAAAYSFNVTAVPHTRLGYLTIWPYGQQLPNVSTLNAPTGTVTANGAIVQAGTSGKIAAFPSNDTDLVVDINGYFASPGSGQQPLSLYALIPCRALDTRGSGGAFQGTIPIAMDTGPCRLTTSAKAFVLNATVVPPGPLGYLTLWPSGQQQPNASTLNALDGQVTSNMAIVLGDTHGNINAYASNATQLVLDISSYFGP